VSVKPATLTSLPVTGPPSWISTFLDVGHGRCRFRCSVRSKKTPTSSLERHVYMLLILSVSQQPPCIFDITWRRLTSLSDRYIWKASDIYSTPGFVAATLNTDLSRRRPWSLEVHSGEHLRIGYRFWNDMSIYYSRKVITTSG